MKLDSKETEVRGSIGLRSSEASISEEDMDKLYKLIEAPYKRPISSIVREYTSNCFDAHQEAGVDDAVIVEFGKSQEIGYYVSFNDVGVGMSEDRMANVFVKLLKSTKEHTNNAIGAWGMGSKAGLSYNDFFFIETNFDGQYYKYIYRKGEKRPTLDLLVQEDTSERNGTKFIVPIKNESDLYQFTEACNTQLHYFENVVFDYKSLENFLDSWNYERIESNLDNDFKLYKGKNFTIRIDKGNLNPSKNSLHILNGPVYYPIDFNNITGISNYSDLKIGLNFEIGELDVIQTREDVRYNEKTVNIIKQRLNDAVEELRELYGTEDIVKTKTYNEYVQKKFDNEHARIIIGEGNYQIVLQHNKTFPKKKVVLNAFYNIDENYILPTNLKSYIFDRFVAHKNITCNDFPTVRATQVEYKSAKTFSNGIHTYNSMEDIVRESKYKERDLPKLIVTKNKESHSVKLNKQIAFKDKEEHFSYNIPVFYIIKEREWDKDNEASVKHYNLVLGLYSIGNDKTKDAIVDLYHKMSNKYVENVLKQPNVIDYDTLQLDEVWYKDFAARHRKKVAERDTTLVNIKERTSTAWVSDKATLHDLANMKDKYQVFIAPDGDKDLLKTIGNESDWSPHSIFHNTAIRKRSIKLISLAVTNYKKLAELVKDKNNYCTMEEFENNKDNIKFKYLSDLYVYHKIKGSKILSFINNVDQTNPVVSKSINEKFQSLINEVSRYIDQIELHYSDWARGNSQNIIDEIEGLSDYAEIKKYYILQKIEKIKKYYVYFNHFFRVFQNNSNYDFTNSNHYNRGPKHENIPLSKNLTEDLDFIASTLVLTNYNRLGIVRPEVYEPVDEIEYNALVESIENCKDTYLTEDYILALVRIKKYEINKIK